MENSLNNNMNSRVQVNLFGREYNLRGDVESDYMLSLSKYVNKKIDHVQSSMKYKDELKIALLVALNLADEVFQLQSDPPSLEYEKKLNDMEDKTKRLISMLETSLIGESPGSEDMNGSNFNLNVA